ncbi:ABC transporter substrate-binding protein [Anaerolineae bacterium CFX9]|nr:ABC transporter substrate-binding protein [Anaerolineae bacterium CFX9]
MKRTLFVITAAALLISLTLGAQAQALTEVRFFITFVPNIQFSPVYVAIAKGYFEDEGIQVIIDHGDEPVGVDLIGAGQRDFGLIGGEQVISARAQGRPVVSVYQWFQQFPVGVVFSDSSGIETVNDLAGRTVGIPGRFGASYSGLIALLNAAGMQESDINLQEIGFNAPEVFCVGAVEASVVYINNEPLQIANRAAQGDCGSVTGVDVIPVGSMADLVSNTVITNEEILTNNPDLVAGFVRAFDRALADVIANPAEAYLLSLDFVLDGLSRDEALLSALEAQAAAVQEALEGMEAPSREQIAELRRQTDAALREQFSADLLLQFEVLLATVELWDADVLGFSDLSSWEATQETLIAMGFVSSPIDLTAAFTNDFIDVAGR